MTEVEEPPARAPAGWDRRIAKVRALYYDNTQPERECEHCGIPYRGPAVYCSLECAQADADMLTTAETLRLL
jgi:hypothetical protein